MAGRKRNKKKDGKEADEKNEESINESESNNDETQNNDLENGSNDNNLNINPSEGSTPPNDPPQNGDDNIEYDIKKAGKFLLKAFEESEEFKKVTSAETRVIQYDKWRKNTNK